MTGTARRPLLGSLAALAAPFLRARPATAQQPTAPANELRLGALFPFTGSFTLLGDESFRGLELAAEERNAAGGLLGRPVRLVKGDAMDQAQALAEVRRLIGEARVAAVFGTYASPLAFAATQAAELAGIPYFELGAIADPITDRGFRYVFRTCPRASDFARESVNAIPDALCPILGLAPEARASLRPETLKLAILHEDGLYGQSVGGFQEVQIKARGLNLVEKLAYGARSIDLSAMIQRLHGLGADVVLHTGYQNDIVLFYRGLREAGWWPRMVIGAGAGYSLTDTARAIGPDFDGTMNVDFTPFAVNERAAPGAAAFAELYQRRYGSEPRSGHSLANYVGAQIGFDALHRAGGTDKDKLRAAVLATDVAEGTTATGWGARFDEKGQNQRARPFLLQWQGNRLMTVSPAEAAVAVLQPRLGAKG
ncbi:ABC transporter ATP-binding protein [Siccirubricoccus deserti]|uniref:ABC transporter substrate-binding protein n=1 Tax=Siccirubricoccus deserti TaxID=2013562 RepID=A0A9X0QXX5_9PROT|nr:ABC transporter substrate-binding protein [Siccirubricoccus deserti]MBC4016019.1 ABC transporter substrate-binding protein [Siccirubricoccus deserti]GGC40004.1 ABC transporter ATP-binding protein [Siccirubricoccus deserti]